MTVSTAITPVIAAEAGSDTGSDEALTNTYIAEDTYNLDDADYVDGEAIIIYHEDPDSLSEVGGPGTGFTIEKTWDMTTDETEDSEDSLIAYGTGNEGLAESDVRIALVNGNGSSTEEMLKELENIDCVEIASPNYYEKMITTAEENTSLDDAGVSLETSEDPDVTAPVAASTISLADLTANADTVDYDKNYREQTLSDNSAEADPLYEYHQYAYGDTNGIALNRAVEKERTVTPTENIVAVMDDGVDYNNPDLAPNIWTDTEGIMEHGKGIHGMNCVSGKYDPMPFTKATHGTHVAGSIAARSGNGIGVAGVAGTGHTKIMGLNVYDPKDLGSSDASVIEGYSFMIEAKKKGFNVVAINNSWGPGPGLNRFSPVINYIITQAGKAGILSFFSAGNDNTSSGREYNFTASENPYIVCVAASDQNNDLSGFSTYDDYHVDLAAPGSRILSTYPVFATANYRIKTTYTATSGSPNTLFYAVSAEDWRTKTYSLTLKVCDSNGDAHEISNAQDLNKLKDYGITLSKGKKGELQLTFVSKNVSSVNPQVLLTYRIKNPFYGKTGLTASDYGFLSDYETVADENSYNTCRDMESYTKIYDASGNPIFLNKPANSGGTCTTHDSTELGYFEDLATSSEYLTVEDKIFVYNATSYRDESNKSSLAVTVRLNGFSIGKITTADNEDSDYAPYGYSTGTSMSCPVLTGMAAEIASIYNISDPFELRGRVVGGTESLSDNRYIHTDSKLNNQIINKSYRDMVSTGGRATFKAMLQDEQSGYNANIWSVTADKDCNVTVNGYALKNAKLTVDGVTVSQSAESLAAQDKIMFTAGSDLLNGETHIFTVTDAESGRTYKTKLTTPEIRGNTLYNAEKVRSVPAGLTDTEMYGSSLVESGRALYLGSGDGSSFYRLDGLDVERDEDEYKWIKCAAPGKPSTYYDLTDISKYDCNDAMHPMRYVYVSGGICALCSAPNENDIYKADLFASYYSIKDDKWSSWNSVIPDSMKSETGYEVKSYSASAFDGKFYIALNTLTKDGYRKSILGSANLSALEELKSNAFSFKTLDDQVWGFSVYNGKLYALARDDDNLYSVREVKGYDLKLSDSAYIDLRNEPLAESLATMNTPAGRGLVGGGTPAPGSSTLSYLDMENKVIRRLGNVGLNTSTGLSAISLSVYGEIGFPDIYILAVPNTGSSNEQAAAIYKAPDKIYKNAYIDQGKLDNHVFIRPVIRTMEDDKSYIEYTYSDALGQKKTISSNKSTVYDENKDALIVHPGDKVTLEYNLSGKSSQHFWYYDLPDEDAADSKGDTSQCLNDKKSTFYAEQSEYLYEYFCQYARITTSVNEKDDDVETSYLVRFYDGKELLKSTYVREGYSLESSQFPEDPTSKNSIFAGWLCDDNVFDTSVPVQESMDLYARYKDDTDNLSPSGSGLDPLIDTTGDYIYLMKGQSVTLSCNSGEKWSTSDSRYVNVNKKTGKVTAKKSTAGLKDANYVTVNRYSVKKGSDNKVETSVEESFKVMVFEPVFKYKKVTMHTGESYELEIKDVSGGDIDSSIPISWVSSKPDVASVTNKTVHALAKGSAKISAYINGKAYNTNITVKDTYSYSAAELNEKKDIEITLTPLSVIKLKKSAQLDFDPKNVADWDYDPNVIALDFNKKDQFTGKITAIGQGYTTLTGTDNKSGVTREIEITTVPMVTKKVTYVNVGKSATLKLNKAKKNQLQWRANNDLITVDNGKIKAGETAGRSLVTASFNCAQYYPNNLEKNFSDYNSFMYRMTVYAQKPSLKTDTKLKQSDSSKPVYELELKEGAPYKLNTEGVFQSVLFKSSKPKIAFVDETGTVFPRSSGTTRLTAKINGQSITVNVTVSKSE
ncbi:MAG: S8 family serine peptidase [Lachnospiraceae bacterium]|nr:S8 family serine peptidase [Lachnospiraceae bacterium]